MYNQIDALLTTTMEDNKLDTDEKQVLYDLLASLSIDEKNYLRNQAFDKVRSCAAEGADIMPLIQWLEHIVKAIDKSYSKGVVNSSAYFSPGADCRDAIIGLLNGARERVDVCVFTLSDNHIRDAIVGAHQRGVTVRIISDNDKANDKGSDIYYLQREGLPVCMDTSPRHMHHKFALIDDRLINGSFNWTRSATEYNQENIVISNQAALLDAFSEVFEQLWQQFSR